VDVPGHWIGARKASGKLDTAALAKWWERFHDPVLNELISQSLRSSTDIRSAVSRIAESRARRSVEIASLLPFVSGGASGQTSRTHNRSARIVSESESYSASLDASWELDLFGRQYQNVKAASAEVSQATAIFYGAEVSLAAEVAEAYLALREAEAQLEVVERSVATRSETLQIAQWREQAGQGNALDTKQSESTLEQARAEIPSLEQSISQGRNRLALLASRTPGSLDPLLSKSRPLPRVPSRLAIGIPIETIRQRPDVQAAEFAVNAATARTKSAQRERLPSINLAGSIGVDALKAGRLFNPEATAASLAAGLVTPIFDAGRIGQNIRIQTEQEKQAILAYESTVLTALSDVENALIAVQRTAERLVVLDRAISAARQAEKLANQQYEAGQVDLLSVLEAQRTLLSLEVQQVATRGDQTSAHIQLYKALGGGWSPRG
jgi:NodT family efflux transporter outer membrane factor (OMF) lipoprotein